jgi:hypothetical protein
MQQGDRSESVSKGYSLNALFITMKDVFAPSNNTESHGLVRITRLEGAGSSHFQSLG